MDENRKHTCCRKNSFRHSGGFTIVELLLVILISSVVLTGIYSVFRAQQKAATTNTQVVMMQQNLRAAVSLLERDIRMAGYSPGGNADAGFVAAQEGFMQVTMDWNDDGDVADADEDISYGFRAADDANRDGILDSLAVEALRRDRGGGMQPMSQNIEAFSFAYAFDDDEDGELDTSGGDIIWAIDSNGDGTLDLNVETGGALGTAIDLDQIQAVRIWLLARSQNAIRNYTDNRTYQVGRNAVSGGPGFMHRTLETVVKCRNMNF